MPIVTWKRPCCTCGREYTTWEVVPDKKEEEQPGWFGDATGLCPQCLAKEKDDNGERGD